MSESAQIEACELIIARRGQIWVPRSWVPGAWRDELRKRFWAQLTTLRERVEAAAPHAFWLDDVIDSSLWLGGTVLASLDPAGHEIVTRTDLERMVAKLPPDDPWSERLAGGGLAASAAPLLRDARRWWERVRELLPENSDELPTERQARALLRRCTELAVWARTGSEQLTPV